MPQMAPAMWLALYAAVNLLLFEKTTNTWFNTMNNKDTVSAMVSSRGSNSFPIPW